MGTYVNYSTKERHLPILKGQKHILLLEKQEKEKLYVK